MSNLIRRQAAIDALDEIESEVADGYGYQYEKWRKYFCELPSAQPDVARDIATIIENEKDMRVILAQPNSKDLVEKIKNGITASDGNSEYFIGLRNGMRWCLSLIDDKEPIYESSAQPERKTGKWMKDSLCTVNGETYAVRRCSQCKSYFHDVVFTWNYCPNCGARMVQEGEDNERA